MDLVIVKLGSEQEDNSRKFFFPRENGAVFVVEARERERSFIIERGGQISRSDVIESISEKEDVHLFIYPTASAAYSAPQSLIFGSEKRRA